MPPTYVLASLLFSMLVIVSRMAVDLCRRRRVRLLTARAPAPPPLPPPDHPNFICGLVLPAPHDPRWVKASDGWKFGSWVHVTSLQVLVGDQLVDAPDKTRVRGARWKDIATAKEAQALKTAIDVSQAAFELQLAKDSVVGAYHGG